MKHILILCALAFASCIGAKTAPISTASIEIKGEPLPAIRHMIDMKMSGDTLLFVFEGNDGYGQRFLRRAVVDTLRNTFYVSSDMGWRENGYYTSYMPYPFIADNGTIGVISQDDCEIYTVVNDTSFVRAQKYIIDETYSMPFALSRYVQDIFMTEPDKYVFIGREPNGGRQVAMSVDFNTSRIDSIRQISISSKLQAWMPNVGEMAYSDKYNRLAFAYKLHPVIDIFDTDGKIINSVKIGNETFDPATLDEADFEDLNPLHTVDITYTHDYIYALYWGYQFADAKIKKPIILKIDWAGNVISRYSGLTTSLSRIAAVDDSIIIGWNGNEFVIITL